MRARFKQLYLQNRSQLYTSAVELFSHNYRHCRLRKQWPFLLTHPAERCFIAKYVETIKECITRKSSLQKLHTLKLYRVGHEKVARLLFAFAFGYCIDFCIYAMLRTRATFSWPTRRVQTNQKLCVCKTKLRVDTTYSERHRAS